MLLGRAHTSTLAISLVSIIYELNNYLLAGEGNKKKRDHKSASPLKRKKLKVGGGFMFQTKRARIDALAAKINKAKVNPFPVDGYRRCQNHIADGDKINLEICYFFEIYGAPSHDRSSDATQPRHPQQPWHQRPQWWKHLQRKQQLRHFLSLHRNCQQKVI